jgi:hypothetical protein
LERWFVFYVHERAHADMPADVEHKRPAKIEKTGATPSSRFSAVHWKQNDFAE